MNRGHQRRDDHRPITVAVESVTTPAVAITADKTTHAQAPRATLVHAGLGLVAARLQTGRA